jgi:uncharacterized membrane protein YhaH (DUF805 family)
MSWFLAALGKYATFAGRARRREYWFFFLFYVLIYFALSFLDSLFGAFDPKRGVGLLSGVFALGMLLPSLAVGARRLHDIGRSGWWLLISLVPLVGLLVLMAFALKDGDPGPNAYGPSPKAVA